jgi:hypothetical protein
MECLCRTVVGGIDLSSTCWTNGVVERWENSSIAYLDIFGPREFAWDRHGFDLGILMGAFLLELHERFGIEFMIRLIQALRQRPSMPQNPDEAAYKVQAAAHSAVGRSLKELFVDRWRWPSP